MSKIFVLKLSALVLSVGLLLSFLSLPSSLSLMPVVEKINAQEESGILPGENLEEPKTRSSTITATVPDIVPPSAPILIAPENDSLLRDSKPSFVWLKSTDNVGVTGYRLFMDGVLLFDNIPTSAISNSSFVLKYKEDIGEFTLTPKSGLSNGSHTWKIQAFDDRDNTSDSTTWEFEIDTQAPQFLITTIEDQETSISAFDFSTIPTEAIELSANQPTIGGTGEAKSTVQVTINIEGSDPEIVTFEIDDEGNWSWQMGILPRDVEIRLDFLITDQVGNISILENLRLILRTEKIIFPPHSPLPSGGPGPGIEIPDLSPTEWRHEILKQILPILPPSLQQRAEEELLTPTGEAQVPQSFMHRLGPLLIIGPTAVSFGAIALLTPHLTIGILWQILLLLLPLLRRRNCGLVFSYETKRGVPYAPVIFDGVLKNGEDFRKTTIANVYGQFAPGKLPEGNYSVTVDHPGFPLGAEVVTKDWYLGGNFEINQATDACIAIPVDYDEGEDITKTTLVRVANLTNPRSNFRWFWLFLGGLVVFLYPSQYNLLILIVVAIIYAIDAVLEPVLRK